MFSHLIFFSDLPYEIQLFSQVDTLKKFKLVLPYFLRVAKAPIFSKLKIGCRLKGRLNLVEFLILYILLHIFYNAIKI